MRESTEGTMRTVLYAGLALILASAGCGTPPNQRLITRTSDYMKAMSFGFESGYPLDIKELERRFPELKGIVITAAQWIDEYEKLKQEAEGRDTPLYEYRISFGTNLTIEVTGEPSLSRTYYVPPTGFVHYPFLKKLKIQGLTVDQLKERLEKDLAVYLKSPEVLIHINHTTYLPSANQPFYQQTFGGAEIVVLGMTRTRFYSNVSFTGKETLVSVLGVTDLPPNAEWRQIRVIRRNPRDPLRKSRVILCDLWDFFAKGDVRQDIPLAPGDIVFVPLRWSTDDQFWEDWGWVKRAINEVFFLDEVRDSVKKGGKLRD